MISEPEFYQLLQDHQLVVKYLSREVWTVRGARLYRLVLDNNDTITTLSITKSDWVKTTQKPHYSLQTITPPIRRSYASQEMSFWYFAYLEGKIEIVDEQEVIEYLLSR